MLFKYIVEIASALDQYVVRFEVLMGVTKTVKLFNSRNLEGIRIMKAYQLEHYGVKNFLCESPLLSEFVERWTEKL